MRSILVTGGAGFIGHHLVKRLLQDYRVVIIDNLSSGRISNIPKQHNAIFYREDIRNKETISDIVKREKIDVCIHLAATTIVSESLTAFDNVMDVNVNGTASILEACSKNRVDRFVFASSAAVYGEATEQPIPEDQELRPISPYGKSKVAGEKLVATHQRSDKIPTAVSLRFFNVYGEGQNPRYAGVITKFVERLSKGLPPVIYGDGMQTRDFVSVNDIVNALIKATNTNTNGTFNIGTGHPVIINELAKEMIEIADLNIAPIYEQRNMNEIKHSVANTIKARQILQFVAKDSLSDTLKDFS